MKIVYLLGKSAAGKDTVFSKLNEQKQWKFQNVTQYTTRPMRDGEKEGEQYYFITLEKKEEMAAAGTIIEERTYQTVYGPWTYLTADDGQIEKSGVYLLIGTLESYQKIREYFGDDCMLPIYLEVEDGLRLERAMARERTQKVPRYAEMCRRFLADEIDFSEENLKKAGIKVRFDNSDLERCMKQIEEMLEKYI